MPVWREILSPKQRTVLKTLDTIGNFQLGVSQHMQKNNKHVNILNSLVVEVGRRSCEIIMEGKHILSHEVVCFQMLVFGTSKSKSRDQIQVFLWKINLFLKTTLL